MGLKAREIFKKAGIKDNIIRKNHYPSTHQDNILHTSRSAYYLLTDKGTKNKLESFSNLRLLTLDIVFGYKNIPYKKRKISKHIQIYNLKLNKMGILQ